MINLPGVPGADLVHLLLLFGPTVTHDDRDEARCRTVAKAMNDWARKHRVRERQGENRSQDEEEWRHFVGEMGLLACCKVLDVPYTRSVGVIRPGLVRGCSVYTTDQRWDDGILWPLNDDKHADDHRVVKCHFHAETRTVMLQGWATLADVRESRNIWGGAAWRGDGAGCYRLKRARWLDTLWPELGIPEPVWPRTYH